MQSVSAAWTAEEKDSVRRIKQDLLVSWSKQSLLDNQTFTIGVSLIGGNDLIGIDPGSIGSPGNYQYLDESAYLMGLGWEHQLNNPLGGLSKSLADADLDNTSGRFLPDYMGGSSELFTSILPRRPIIINGGFVVDGVEQTIPQFSGLLNRAPEVNLADKVVSLQAEDYVGYFDKNLVDETALYTGFRTDQIFEEIFLASGMSTSQYQLDMGINTIPFAVIPVGSTFTRVIDELAQSENGYVFQDEEGVFHFWNRQHFDSSPYNEVQRILTTGQVLNVEAPNEDHIINSVEIVSNIYEKRANQTIYELVEPIQILSGQEKEVFVSLDSPVLQVTGQTVAGNTQADGSGASITITVEDIYVFADAIKYIFSSSGSGYITQLDITGRSAVVAEELNVREQDSSSLTAYQEKKLVVNNPYIQDRSWAESYSRLILETFAEPQNLLKIKIRAIPELQRGDLISWQGNDWRVFSIRSNLSASQGYLQDLVVYTKDFRTYFRIGISTIGGVDSIAS